MAYRNAPNGPGENPEELPFKLGAYVEPQEEKDPKRVPMRPFLLEHEESPKAQGGVAVYHRIPDTPLDQDQTSACVGHCGHLWELSYPNPFARDPHDDQPARLDTSWPAITDYFGAQENDEWSGGEYPGGNPKYEGTSLAGLAAYYQQEKRILGAYAWAKSEQDVIDWLRLKTGVMFASRWHKDMFHPDGQGFIHPTGSIVGGHAYFLFGVDEQDNVYMCNSWGVDWGLKNQTFDSEFGKFSVKGGVAKISRDDLKKLFSDGDAEGFAPVKVGGGAPVDPQSYYPNLKRYNYINKLAWKKEECIITDSKGELGHFEPKPKS